MTDYVRGIYSTIRTLRFISLEPASTKYHLTDAPVTLVCDIMCNTNSDLFFFANTVTRVSLMETSEVLTIIIIFGRNMRVFKI